MLILVDGPDGAGKTTLMDRLVALIRAQHPHDYLRLYHKKPPTRHPLEEYVEPLLGYRPDQGIHVVADRWHWGEAVYPDLFDRPTQMDVGIWRYTEMFLRSRGALVVHVDVPSTLVHERLNTRGDDMVRLHHVKQMVANYRAASARSQVYQFRYGQHVRFGVAQEDDAVVLANVLACARRVEREASPLNAFETYVGPVRPDFVLVGDERPPRMDRDHPAFMPFAPKSGHYLLNALRGPRIRNLGLVNANDVDDVTKAWEVLGCPRLVTLGRLADKKCRQLPHGKVPHPQFVRRFYQRHRDEYGLAIDEALATGQDLLGWRPASPSWRPR